MSLINNMLKDLEKRDKPHRDIPYVTLLDSKQRQSWKLPSKSIVSISVFFTGLIVLFTTIFFHKNTMLLPMLNDNTQKSTPTTASDPSWLKPVSITGVTMQVKDNITEVTFLLNHPALYRLISDDLHNQLAIVIDQSQLQSELPPVNYLNTAIQQITAKTLNQDTEFTLAFAPGASIKYVNLNTTNNNAELVVAIEYLPVDKLSKSSASDSAIKAPAMQNLLIQQYQSALLTAENGQYQIAIDHLTSLLKIDPGYKDARVSLSALLIDQGSSLKAKHLIDEGLNEYPEFVPFIELKARILANERKYKQALSVLQATSPAMEENPEYHAFIAAMYQQNNEHSLAIELYKKLLTLNSNNSSWWFGLGVSLDKLGKDKNAIEAYTKALSEGHLNPDSLAYLQNRLQKLQEAVDDKE